MSTLLIAAVLGALQGLTEFLPVSSTAHLLLGERLLGFDDPGSVFTEMIQLGSILAIVWIYRDKIGEVVAGLPANRRAQRFALAILIAFIPAVVAGLLLADYVEGVLHQSPTVIAWAFIIGGIVMLAVERFARRPTARHVDDASYGQALIVGLCQMLALIPGVSRSGSTIVGGLLAGLDRPTAAEFSFFLAMPTLAATFAHSALELRAQLTADRMSTVAVGFVCAGLASLAVVRPFLAYVRRVGFAPFAWYRIAAGAAVLGAHAAGLL